MDLIVNDSEESSWKRKEHPDEEEYLLFIAFILWHSQFLGYGLETSIKRPITIFHLASLVSIIRICNHNHISAQLITFQFH